MFEPTLLDDLSRSLCHRTISPNAFFLLVQDSLLAQLPLSVVRMGDGEWLLWQNAAQQANDSGLATWDELAEGKSAGWLKGLGLEGITKQEIRDRLILAAKTCLYFAPSLSGVIRADYNLYSLFPARPWYVDNFFVNQWTEEMISQLYQQAKLHPLPNSQADVLLVHHNVNTADAFLDRALRYLGVMPAWLQYSHWTESDKAVARAKEINAPLTIASVGPAGKFMLPQMPGVVLDIGQSIDRFILCKTWQDAEAKKAFGAICEPPLYQEE